MSSPDVTPPAGAIKSFSQGHVYDPAKDGAPKLYTDVLYDYEAQKDEELTIRAGDEVAVLKTDSFNGNFLERFQQHTLRITEFEKSTKPARATAMQSDTWSARLQAAETEVKQLQESLAALRHDVEKTIGDRAQPLSATDVERTVYDLIKLGMLLEEDGDELTEFGQRLRTAWNELKALERDLKKDLTAVPQLGNFRQQILNNMSQLMKAMREEEASRQDMSLAVDDCLNSLVSLRIHMEGRRRDKDEESSSTSSRGGSSIKGNGK